MTLIPWVAACDVTSTAPETDPSAVDWVRSVHPLGKGHFRAENVVHLQPLRLRTPPRSNDGGEVYSAREYGPGTFAARLHCPDRHGIICAFFLYQQRVGDDADEIDIEVIPERGVIAFTVWRVGRRVYHATRPWSPGEAIDVAIHREPGRVRFEVEGEEVARFDGDEQPLAHMPLYASIWWPNWLHGVPDDAAATFEVTRVRVVPPLPDLHSES